MADAPAALIALEEHYTDPALAPAGALSGPLAAALTMDDAARIAGLDAAGIAVQVLSLAPPGLQGIAAPEAAEAARGANDRLAARVAASGGRLAGFAALPTADPAAAEAELARAVEELGLPGGMIHGPTAGRFLDAPEYRPLLARAAALKVPLYLHPSDPLGPVREAYYAPYDQTHPMFLRAGWGYTVETGTHAMRLVLGRVFEDCPDLQVILGHMGEGIPFLMDRIDEALARDTPMKNFAAVFRAHFHVTTSGFFSDAALACCLTQLGPERVMFSVDAPFASTDAGTAWIRDTPLAPAVRAMICAGNARRLLGLE